MTKWEIFVRSSFCSIVFAVICVASVGCSTEVFAEAPIELFAPSQDNAVRNDRQKYEEWNDSVEATKVPAKLFPDAAKIVAYAGGDFGLGFDSNGNGTTEVMGADHRFHKVKAKKGGRLTASEAKTLRNSVFFSPPPPAVALCCIPRHGFAFYDKNGRFLGFLKVCFECGCARSSEAPPDPSLNWILWDHAAIQKILEAHHLPVNDGVTGKSRS